MDKKGWIWISILIGFLVIIVVIMILALLSKPFDPSKQCSSFEEYNKYICIIPQKQKTNKYPKPTEPLILGYFEYSQSRGRPWCKPTYYAYQYIDEEGKYGPMSDWTTVPVIAGSNSYPGCDEGCTGYGKKSCTYNRPTIGVKDASKLKYTGKDKVWPQLYQTLEDPKLGSPKQYQAIGYILPSSTGDIQAGFVDLFNPNNDEAVCSGC